MGASYFTPTSCMLYGMYLIVCILGILHVIFTCAQCFIFWLVCTIQYAHLYLVYYFHILYRMLAGVFWRTQCLLVSRFLSVFNACNVLFTVSLMTSYAPVTGWRAGLKLYRYVLPLQVHALKKTIVETCRCSPFFNKGFLYLIHPSSSDHFWVPRITLFSISVPTAS